MYTASTAHLKIGKHCLFLVFTKHISIVHTCSEELRYDYGFPHAEWTRSLEAPGTKINIEAATSKNKKSREVDEPSYQWRGRRNWKLSSNNLYLKEKSDDSEKRVASTMQRKGKESEVPVKEVSKFYLYLNAKNLTIPLQLFSLQSCNKSSKAERNITAETVEKAQGNIQPWHGTEDLNEIIAKQF